SSAKVPACACSSASIRAPPALPTTSATTARSSRWSAGGSARCASSSIPTESGKSSSASWAETTRGSGAISGSPGRRARGAVALESEGGATEGVHGSRQLPLRRRRLRGGGPVPGDVALPLLDVPQVPRRGLRHLRRRTGGGLPRRARRAARRLLRVVAGQPALLLPALRLDPVERLRRRTRLPAPPPP